jgi:hypothetical protein
VATTRHCGLAEDRTREIFTPELELHVLELENLALAPPDRQGNLERWARFLRARTPEEREALAQEAPIMNTARDALERLSSDPEAQRLAEESETAQLMHQHYMASAFEAGEAKERRETVRSLCEVLSIEIDTEREHQLSSLNLDGLSRLVQKLKAERQWPRDL